MANLGVEPIMVKMKKMVSEICIEYLDIQERIIYLFELKYTPIQLKNSLSDNEEDIIYQVKSNSDYDSS